MKNHPPLHQRISTASRSQIIDITDCVRRAARQQSIRSGLAIIFIPHTTAAVTINENADPDVKHDLLRKLESLIPQREAYYQHGEGNSDSHLKTACLGNSAMVLIENSDLLLGTWQGVYFCEFDGPRERTAIIKLIDWD